MRKFYTVLYLAVILSCMAACGKNDIQAQTPGHQAEPSAIESSSQSDSLNGSENAGESSVAMDSTETADETISESAVVDETEGRAESAETANEAESVTETEGNETEGNETEGNETEGNETEGNETEGNETEENETGRNETDTAETNIQNNPEENRVTNMNVQVGDAVFSATLEENEAVSALVEMMRESPVVIRMSDYSGFEKVGPLGTKLPVNNSQTTTQAGDIVLYNGNQIVIFYGSNSWSYTRLGHIDDLTGWEDALGSGDVTVTFSLE